MNKGLVSGLVLLVFGLVCGLLLAVVNHFTEPVIKDQELQLTYSALNEFYNIDEYDFSTVNLDNEFSTIQVNLFERNFDVKVEIDKVYVFKDKSTGDIDALVYSVQAYGYSSDVPIQMLIAINKDLSIKDYKVIKQQETSGFGSKIVDKDFKVSDINDLSNFDGISGVTFSSKAVLACFTAVQDRAASDFGGGLND